MLNTVLIILGPKVAQPRRTSDAINGNLMHTSPCAKHILYLYSLPSDWVCVKQESLRRCGNFTSFAFRSDSGETLVYKESQISCPVLCIFLPE